MGFSRLSPLQRAVLEAIFAREQELFLTGGAALAEFYLGHRTTDDLDLFTTSASAFERSRHVIAAVADDLGARLEIRQDAPGFRRYALARAGDTVIVDAVHERVPQGVGEKPRIGAIIVDPPEEILANKLTAVVGRMEERDLVDLLFLERAGYRIEDALSLALAKDGGCTPATLAWLLSEVQVPDGVALPGDVKPEELRAFVSQLVVRLRRAALPGA
ncbi:MAG: nucleotidyl transferase AbiEii/AbiGii toxin family protein [Labilithrix sp.]|nr:nucleotidyl transferase AbiEii/AbiGii toxin family protein [Labilithrix sp.]